MTSASFCISLAQSEYSFLPFFFLPLQCFLNLCLTSLSRGQWDVVGDTFVVGCKFSDKIIYPGSFENNPDFHDAVYSTEYGVYKPHCGLENVMLSWGHDEVGPGSCFNRNPDR
jgi:hypothetical protein